MREDLFSLAVDKQLVNKFVIACSVTQTKEVSGVPYCKKLYSDQGDDRGIPS